MMSRLEQMRVDALEKRIEKLEAELARTRIESIEPAPDAPIAEPVERPTLTLKRGARG